MSEKLCHPLREYKCKGKMHYNSCDFDTDFTFSQMHNGHIVGKVETSSQVGITELSKECFNTEVKLFSLSGIDESGSEIIVEQCYFSSVRIGTQPVVGEFVAHEVWQNPKRLSQKPKNKIVVALDILNIDETFRVKVDTRIGNLLLRPIKNQKELLSIVRILKMSAVTGVVEIFVQNVEDYPTFSKLLAEAIDVTNGFLHISRLANTCYSDWCSVTILEETVEGSDVFKPIVLKMSLPKSKTPSFRSLTNPAHSSVFYESAYSGYKGHEEELKTSYNFDVALEWYLEANIASVLESKYLMACTCLELLKDKYQKASGTEFIMEQEFFKNSLYPALLSSSRTIMNGLNLSSNQRSEIYMKMRGMNRVSIRTAIESLLNELRIKYDDLFEDVGEIVEARNAITHTGTYQDTKQLLDVFNRLYVLLTRAFLSILKYKQDYVDWHKHQWVQFSDVSY